MALPARGVTALYGNGAGRTWLMGEPALDFRGTAGGELEVLLSYGLCQDDHHSGG